MQDSVSQSGTLQIIIHELGHVNTVVKTSAIWALANMAYMASPTVSQALLRALPWTQVCDLLQADSSELQVGIAHCSMHASEPCTAYKLGESWMHSLCHVLRLSGTVAGCSAVYCFTA